MMYRTLFSVGTSLAVKKLPSGGFGPAESDEADQTREPHRNVPFSDRTINSTVANQLDHEHAPQSAVDPISSHLREIIELKNEQIVMLQSQVETANAQISVKDEQIATMHERDHETNILIQNLQGLVALPQARAEPNMTSRTDQTPIDINHGSDQHSHQFA